MPIKKLQILLLSAAFTLSGAVAHAVTLISDDEARLPDDASADIGTRSITRGPTVEHVIDGSAPLAHVPFPFIVHFEPHGGSKIDPASVRVFYIKKPNVDLTERLKPYISPAGIDMPDAVVPEGKHVLEVVVGDSDGRSTTTYFDIKAGGK